jgi:predicted glycosyltransferase
MKLLIDIKHPAHVHFYKNFINIMKSKGHRILVTSRQKDVTLQLLSLYQIRNIQISTLKGNLIDLGIEFILRTWKLMKIAKKFKPDVMIATMGPSISVAGALLKIPSIVFYNNESAKLTNFFVYRLANRYVTSTSYEDKVRGNHVTYRGYHELAYLHPKYFMPDKTRLSKYSINPADKYFVIRFVSWQSSHDIGALGFSDKEAFVEGLSRYGRVLITSEQKLPAHLFKYRIMAPPNMLLDILAFSHLYVGESATVASEAACLGIPAIYLANTKRGYTNELEKKFGLVYNYVNQNDAFKKAIEIAKRSKASIADEFQAKRNKMLNCTNDVTKWLVNYIHNFSQI